MKKLLLALAALLAPLMPAMATSIWPVSPSFVAIATVTPPASGSYAAAFQNISAGVDVYIQRIDIISVDTGAATGGIMQWQIFASTALTAGPTLNVSQQSYQAALTNGAQDNSASPTNVVAMSTSPTNVVIEANLPIVAPMLVNDSPTATTNLFAEYQESPGGASNATTAILLPKGKNRALVFRKDKLGGTDVTDGLIMIRVEYTTR